MLPLVQLWCSTLKGSQNPVAFYHLIVGLVVTGLPRVSIALSTYSSDSHQIRSILNSISSKAFCPARESCGFQGPTAFLLPCHLVHTFPIYFLSLSGFLNVAGRQLQPLLWPCGLCSFGKTTAHSVTSFFFQQDMFFISWRFCAYKRSASHFPSFNSTIIFITWNMPEWSHLLWSKNPWAQGLF